MLKILSKAKENVKILDLGEDGPTFEKNKHEFIARQARNPKPVLRTLMDSIKVDTM